MDAPDKLPPQDLGAESAVIGAALIDAVATSAALEILDPSDFYKGAHRTIWAAVAELHACGEPVDLRTLRARLEDAGRLEEAGGVAYLGDLAATVPSSAHVESYARRVQEKARLRRLIEAGTVVVRAAFEPGASSGAVLERADAALLAVAGDREQGQGADAAALADELTAELDAPEAPAGLRCGLPLIDGTLGGLRPGELVITAARTNTGKTTCALNVLRNVAEVGTPVLFFSLEMSRQAITKHLVRQRTGLDLFRQRPQGADLEAARAAADELRALPFIVVDGSAGLPAVRARVRREVLRGRCGLVILDYLQRMTPPPGCDSRNEQVAALARGLKSVAVDAAVPVLALCQLNRESEKREDRRPRLSDLRDSGELEQEADAVILLHRPYKDRPTGSGSDTGELDMILAKSRNTGTGEAVAWLDLPTGLIWDDRFARDAAANRRGA